MPVLRACVPPFTGSTGAKSFAIAVAHPVAFHADAVERHPDANAHRNAKPYRNAEPNRNADSNRLADTITEFDRVISYGNTTANRNAHSTALMLPGVV